MNTIRSLQNQTTISDIIPYVKSVGVGAVVGSFRRVLGFPELFTRVNFPESKLAERLSYPHEFVKLDKERCENRPRFLGLLNRVDQIKNKMGIEKEVRVVLDMSSNAKSDGSCLGTVSSFTPIVIVIHMGMLLMPEEELNALIAHELSHALHKDALKVCLKSGCILAAEIAASYFFTPVAIPFIEMGSALFSCVHSQRMEKAADLKAIEVLGTSEGTIASIQKQIDINLKMIRSGNANDRISPEGNNRDLISHPPLTERLRYCKEWKSS